MLTPVTTWFLEMASPARLRLAGPPRLEAQLLRAEQPCPELSYFLYRAVGGPWYWLDRLEWTYAQWLELQGRVETWVAYVGGTPAGYFELERQPDGSVLLVYFGLLRWAIGQGLGGWMLTRAIQRAWELGATTVKVNTCSLDGEYALRNYQARGFSIVRIDAGSRNLPDEPPGTW